MRINRTIADDELALKMCGTLPQWRRLHHITQQEAADKVGGISRNVIQRAEINAGTLSQQSYNHLASYFGWPKYEPSRRIEAMNATASRTSAARPGKVAEDRQYRFNFDAPSPAEALMSWFSTKGEAMKKSVKILSSLYRVDIETVITHAIDEYITNRQQIIAADRDIVSLREDLRKRLPL